MDLLSFSLPLGIGSSYGASKKKAAIVGQKSIPAGPLEDHTFQSVLRAY